MSKKSSRRSFLKTVGKGIGYGVVFPNIWNKPAILSDYENAQKIASHIIDKYNEDKWSIIGSIGYDVDNNSTWLLEDSINIGNLQYNIKISGSGKNKNKGSFMLIEEVTGNKLAYFSDTGIDGKCEAGNIDTSDGALRLSNKNSHMIYSIDGKKVRKRTDKNKFEKEMNETYGKVLEQIVKQYEL